MPSFVVNPNAAEDTGNIWNYLAEHVGESYADALLDRLVTTIGDLAEMPGQGHHARI